MDHEEYLSDASLIEDDGKIHQIVSPILQLFTNLRIFHTKMNVHKNRTNSASQKIRRFVVTGNS